MIGARVHRPCSLLCALESFGTNLLATASSLTYQSPAHTPPKPQATTTTTVTTITIRPKPPSSTTRPTATSQSSRRASRQALRRPAPPPPSTRSRRRSAPNVLDKMHAPPEKSHPIATPDVLKEADGVLSGMPTRIGSAPSQVRAFFDETRRLWAEGRSWASQRASSSARASRAVARRRRRSPASSYGMTFAPLGYRSPLLFSMDEVHCGSLWGAGTFAALDGSRQPAKLELDISRGAGRVVRRGHQDTVGVGSKR